MKKRNNQGGYALLYVLIVLAVLTIFAAVVSTAAMQNLRGQRASVGRTKDLYAAEGMIEAFYAEAQKIEIEGTADEPADPAGLKTGLEALETELNSSADGASLECDVDLPEEDEPATCTVTSVCGTVQVKAVLRITLDTAEPAVPDTLTVKEIEYYSYEISGAQTPGT